MDSTLSLDNAQQLLIEKLRQPNISSPSQVYDLSLHAVAEEYLCRNYKVPNTVYLLHTQKLDPLTLVLEKDYISKTFFDAAWELCRLGIIRPGAKHGNTNLQNGWKGEGYCITPFGVAWLASYAEDNAMPASPNKFSQLFSGFQRLFGSTFFKRTQEAVSCYKAGVYLACCAMCGAAAESILLATAFQLEDKEKILKMYFTTRGRSRVENTLFGQADKYIKERYSKYTDLISYWRDESAHGHTSAIDHHQAYIYLITLLRFAQFMRDHWNTILRKERSQETMIPRDT